MSDIDEMLKEIHNCWDGEVQIDEASAEKGEMTDTQRAGLRKYLPYGGLRSLTYSSGWDLKSVLEDSDMGPWFRERTKKIKIMYDPDLKKNMRLKWDGETMEMRFGQEILGVSESTVYYIRDRIRNSFEFFRHQKKFKEEIIPKAEDTIARTFGPGKRFDIDVDWDSFNDAQDQAEGPRKAVEYLMNWDGYYTTQRLTQAVYYLSSREEDPIVDAVADGLKKVTFALEPGTETEKKTFEVDKKGNVTLKMVFEAQSSNGVFESEELMMVLMVAGLRNKPEYKTYLLSSVCSSYRIHYWGDINQVEDLVGKESMGLFSEWNEEEFAVADKSKHEGRIIKFFTHSIKINPRGRKQKRNLLVTTLRWYTAEILKGPAIKEKNYHEHNYTDIVCIDIYPMGKMPLGTKPLAFTVYTNEPKAEKKGLFGGLKIKLPGVKLPGVPLPNVNLPKINLPNVDLPSLPKIDLPSLPKIDLPDLPDISMPELFKRKKEPKPKRWHPANKTVVQKFEFCACDLDVKPGNVLVEEMAWVLYAAWCAETRRHNPEPFYLKEKKIFETSTEIEDARPKIEEEKAAEKK